MESVYENFVIEGNTLLLYKGEEEVVRVPLFIERINKNAFADCETIREIILPDNLLYIGKHAFSGCSNLERINIPRTIGELSFGVFKNCTNLKEIFLLVENDIKIDFQDFDGCQGSINMVFVEKDGKILNNDNQNVQEQIDFIIWGPTNSEIKKWAFKNKLHFYSLDNSDVKKIKESYKYTVDDYGFDDIADSIRNNNNKGESGIYSINKKFISFSGGINRKYFLLHYFICTLLSLLLYISYSGDESFLLVLIVTIQLTLLSLRMGSLFVRRIKDAGYSPYVSLIPVFNLFTAIIIPTNITSHYRTEKSPKSFLIVYYIVFFIQNFLLGII